MFPGVGAGGWGGETGYNYLLSWRKGLFFNKMDKQAIWENMMFPDASEM